MKKHAFLLIPVMGEASLTARVGASECSDGDKAAWEGAGRLRIRGSMVMAMDSMGL